MRILTTALPLKAEITRDMVYNEIITWLSEIPEYQRFREQLQESKDKPRFDFYEEGSDSVN